MKRKTDNFNKFYNKKRNSAIKEQFRQEKKAAKKERKEAIERRFEEKRKARGEQFPADAGRPGRNFGPAGRNAQPAASGRGASKGYPQDAGNNAPPAYGKGAGSKGAPQSASGKGAASSAISKGAPQPISGGPAGETLPLNKYIAHGGICSRREAADIIRNGKVSVNGQTVTEPGTKVLPTDTVKVNGKKVTISRNFVYILLNKPKDYITTTDDPQGRKTVLDLIRQATIERVYPVGRLDRNTSGVLLLTNDGDLSQKLAHPSHEIKKIYHVALDKPLTKADFDKIAGGEVVLEDGAAYVDALAYADPKDKTQIGLEIHSGRNRIVRRIFEHLGYDVRGLDRVMYAGLTKKNVQRGKWRLLSEKEIRILKYLNSSIKGSPARAKDWAAIGAEPGGKTPLAAEPAKKESRGGVTPAGAKAPRLKDSPSAEKTDHFEGSSAEPKRPRFKVTSSAEKKPRRDASSSSDNRPRRNNGPTPEKRPRRDVSPSTDKRRPRFNGDSSADKGRRFESSSDKGRRFDSSSDRGRRSDPSSDKGRRFESTPNKDRRFDSSSDKGGRFESTPEKGRRFNAEPGREKGSRPATPRATGKGAPGRPGKRPARAIPPKGRKSAAAPAKPRLRKSNKFNNEGE